MLAFFHNPKQFDFPTSTPHNPAMPSLLNAVVTISDISRGGKGVARLEGGQVVFVPFTAIGDQVRIEYLESKKNYLDIESMEVIAKGEDHITPPCPAFTKCGGCEWQHLPYEKQWQIKTKGLLHSLARSQANPQNLTLEEFPADSPWHYRNRIQMRGFQDKLGFYARGSKKIISIEKCWIAREEINSAIPKIKEEGQKFTKPYKVEISMVRSGEIQTHWNSRHSAGGFRQVFDEQNSKLREWIFHSFANKGTLLDLFGGSGNLSELFSAKVEKIYCVDTFLPEQLNSEGRKNTEWIAKPVHEWMQSLPANFRADLAILDPPREGLDIHFLPILEGLDRAKVKEVILVGCDVDSWTRDVCRFQRHGWKLQRIAALDLFPQTHHLESLAYFTKSH